jgi:exopolysaccharide biosynthesis polyprenyl glycosylphosphotransferase
MDFPASALLDRATPASAVARPPRRRRRATARLIAGLIVVCADLASLAGALALSRVAALWGSLFLVSAVIVLAVRGHYRVRISPSVTEEAGALVACLAVPVIAVAWLDPAPSASGVLRMGGTAVGLLLGGRAVTYAALRVARSRGWLVEATLVIGAGQVGAEIAGALLKHPSYGLRPIGFLDEFEDDGLPVPILGSVDDLDSALWRHGVSRVIVAFGATRDPEMVGILRSCRHASVEIHVLPRFFELGMDARGAKVDKLWGLPLVRLRRSAFRTAAWRAKRLIDIGVAAVGLILTAPLYGAIVMAIRLTSPGPALFRQERVGQDGRSITVLKFRSMVVNDDADTTWSVAGDSRVTAVGGILRRTGLDELPQLWNVMRGDMSVVGPRPERPRFVLDFSTKVASYDERLRVPPGITGSAQIHGLRGNTSITERTRFDNQYIEDWSLWQDIFIIVRTVRTLFGHDTSEHEPVLEPAAEKGPARARRRRTPPGSGSRGQVERSEALAHARDDQAAATSVA